MLTRARHNHMYIHVWWSISTHMIIVSTSASSVSSIQNVCKFTYVFLHFSCVLEIFKIWFTNTGCAPEHSLSLPKFTACVMPHFSPVCSLAETHLLLRRKNTVRDTRMYTLHVHSFFMCHRFMGVTWPFCSGRGTWFENWTNGISDSWGGIAKFFDSFPKHIKEHIS